MEYDVMFFIESIALGIGLAMDAFSVSIADGLNEKNMKKSKMFLISGTFGLFQALMPIIGWVCVHTLLTYFKVFAKFIPYIALFLLSFIGIKMIIDGVKDKKEDSKVAKLTIIALLVQAIATSIDSLSVGFSIAEYDFLMALVSVLIIGVITFLICIVGVIIGQQFNTKLSNKAQIIGGIILILVGLEILISSFF